MSKLPTPSDKIAAACRKQVLSVTARLADIPSPLAWLQQKPDPDTGPGSTVVTGRHLRFRVTPEGLQEAQFLTVAAGAYQAHRAKMLSEENFQKVLRYYGGKLQEVFLRHFAQDAVVSTVMDLGVPAKDREAVLAQTSAMYVAATFNAVAENIREFPDCREFLAMKLPPGMATAGPAGSGSN